MTKKVLILTPYPIHKAASQRFRHEHYLPYFKDYDLTYDYRPFLSEYSWSILYQQGYILPKLWAVLKGLVSRFFLLGTVWKYEFVYIHREATPLGPPVIEWVIARLLRKKIIYDFDDAIWIPNTSNANKMVSSLKWHSKVASICQWSYKVSVGNSFLGNFASQYNASVVIFPTVVDTGYHLPKEISPREDGIITIGWTGTHSTVSYLKSLIPVLERLNKIIPFRFMVISDQPPPFHDFNFTHVKWRKATEISDLQQIQIGIMPLEVDFWSEGKCGFKAIQYSALGIPAVVSPVGVNMQVVVNGKTGYWCQTPEEWEKSLISLLKSDELRTKMGAEGRKHIIDNYSIRSQLQTFFSLFH